MKYNSVKAYGDAEGPFGFPMRSDVAKEVEQLVATLPANCRELVKDGPLRVVKVAAAMDFKEGERADISLITTATADRDFEVMLPQGGDFRQYRKNPVVTFAHKYSELPVGRSLWLKRQKDNDPNRDGWLAKTRYSTRPEDWEGGWFPDAVWHLISSGELPGKSIGFIPTEVRPPDEKEIRGRPELTKIRTIIAKWLVLEYAVAPVQANPDALVQEIAKAKTKGLAVPEWMMKEFGLIVPDSIPGLNDKADVFPDRTREPITPENVVTEEQARADTRKAVADVLRETVPQAVRDTIDRMRGRV